MANAVLGSLAALLLAALSARLFRDRLAAIATGLAAALHPGLVSLSTDVQSEPLFLVLLLGAGYFLLAAADRPSSNLAVGAGVLLAAAALTRPSALCLAPLLAAPLFDRRYPARARAHLAASALLGFVLGLAPWTLRNALVFHELVPVNDAAGSAFYQGNSDAMVRFYGLSSREQYDRWAADTATDLRNATGGARASRRLAGARSRAISFVPRSRSGRRPGRLGDARGAKGLGLDSPLSESAVLASRAAVGDRNPGALAHGARPPSASRRRTGRASGISRSRTSLTTWPAHVALIVVWRYRLAYWDPVLLLYAIPAALGLERRLGKRA